MLFKNNPLHNQILEANRTVHRTESDIYDIYHSEIFNWYESAQIQHDILFIQRLLNGKTAIQMLDVGCGTGNISLRFIENSDYQITALDLSESMLNRFREKIPHGSTVELIHSSIEEYLDKNCRTFDLITFNSILHHLYRPYEVFEAVLRILNPRGVLFVAHEPLMMSLRRENFFSRRIEDADRVLSHLYWLYRLRQIIRIDHTLSDYQRQGIDLEQLEKILNDLSCVYRCSRCAVRRTSIASVLENQWLKTWNSFRLIAQKCSPTKTILEK